MLDILRKIVKGCGYLPGYGTHPGTIVVISLALIGALAGITSKSPDKLYGALVGASFMSVFILPLYFYGAYERANDYEKEKNGRND